MIMKSKTPALRLRPLQVPRHLSLAALAALWPLALSFSTTSARAQIDDGVTRLDEYRRPSHRTQLLVPNLPGFLTLKCDFHMHSVFSDGHVWPTVRVREAWSEGLDALSLTEHLEYNPHSRDIPIQHDRPHALITEAAKQANLVLIHGAEITRNTPPGHFNALFLQDASAVFRENRSELDAETITAAHAQKAFIFWNHPGWKATQVPGSYEWLPFLDTLLAEGKLHGIEVINGFGFHRKALDWAIDKNLAVIGNTDVHGLTAHDYDLANGRTRTMTLVFARERSAAGIREALDARRSVAWASQHLAGPEEHLRALFHAAVETGPVHHTDARGTQYLEIRNASDLTFRLRKVGGGNALPGSIDLPPRSARTLAAPDILTLLAATDYEAQDTFVRSDRRLRIRLTPTPESATPES